MFCTTYNWSSATNYKNNNWKYYYALCGVSVYSPAFTSIRCTYLWTDGQAELTSMADGYPSQY